VVGFTAAGRFIIRNSWGTAWGDKGFAYASPEYIAAGFFDESYGVTL
jgi:C1A family cysteine protease